MNAQHGTNIPVFLDLLQDIISGASNGPALERKGYTAPTPGPSIEDILDAARAQHGRITGAQMARALTDAGVTLRG